MSRSARKNHRDDWLKKSIPCHKCVCYIKKWQPICFKPKLKKKKE